MPCYQPMTVYRTKGRNHEKGTWPITFKRSEGFTDKSLQIRCNQCIGCRLDRSRIWAIRCMHESQLYRKNIFITLTYEDNKLPPNFSLHKPHMTEFFKRMRKNHGKFRYYQCGEYGETNLRPHHHAIIFGFDFDDKIIHSNNNGNILYKSEKLNKTWSHGHCLIGDVTFDSCAYVARYILKKTLGKDSIDAYTHYDKETGEILYIRTPEYTTMSRKPGLGKAWFDKYQQDVYYKGSQGLVTQKGGATSKAPRFYDLELEKENPKLYKHIKYRRSIQTSQQILDSTEARLRTREKVQKLQINKLIRKIE